MTTSVGRIVHYTPPDGELASCLAAIVTYAHPDGNASLEVFYPMGINHVPLDLLWSVPERQGTKPAGDTWHEPEHVPGSRPPRH